MQKTLSLVVLICVSNATIASAGDTLITNAKIYTLDADQPSAEAMILDGNMIEFVGTANDAIRRLERGGKTIDARGRFIMPGMIDTHTHPGLAALLGGEDDEDDAQLPQTSKQELFDFLRKFASKNPDLPFIVLGEWNVEHFAPDGPNKADLDAIFPKRPVILFDNSGHSMWVNSAALAMFGITKDTPDLSRNLSYFVRDENGEPTGWAKEFSLLPYLKDVLAPTHDVLMARLVKFLDHLQNHGVTSLMDAGNFMFDDMIYQALARLDRAGKLHIRYEGTFHIFARQHLEQAIGEVKRLQQEYGGEKLSINTVKIHLDGVSEINTSGVLEPFSNEPTSRGGVLFSSEELAKFIVNLSREGIDLHVHSVADRSTRVALDAVESARTHLNIERLPIAVSLAHLELVAPTDIPRFKSLGVNANFTPHWFGGTVFSGGDIALGEERQNRSQMANSFVKSEANVTFSSDVVSMPGRLRATPMIGIQMGATRQEFTHGPSAKVFAPQDERVSVANMIRGYTCNAAIQMGVEDNLGVLRAGNLADLVVLDSSPLEADVYTIHKNVPKAVLIGGKLVVGSWED